MKSNIIIMLCAVSLALQFIAIQSAPQDYEAQVESGQVNPEHAVWRVILNREVQTDDSVHVLQSHVLLEIGDNVLTFEELQ